MSEDSSKQVMRISWGPQHPMSGQVRILIDTDGEKVLNIIPDIGFTHRGIEKILENRNIVQGIVPIERMVMVDTANIALSYVRAAEEILGIEPPKRAQYIRVILCEVCRILSHLYGFGLAAEACGGYPAVFLWTTADREPFLDLMERITGTRWSYSFFVPGGVYADFPDKIKEKFLATLDYFEQRLEAYKRAWFENKIFEARAKNVGILKPEDALRLGAAGPNLRGSGVALDVRKDEPYEAYDEIDFKVVTRSEGDSYARLMVRYLEMVESVKILRQAIENMPSGPYRKFVSPLRRLPKGEAYSRVETARGEIGVHIISDGGTKPYRVKIVSPTLRNLYVVSQMPKISEILLADVPVILYSFDPWYLDADR